MLNEDFWLLVKEFEKANSSEKLENLLKGLLTPKEIEEFARRIRLVKLLKQGMGQHTIAKQLGLGVATVGRGAKELHEGNFKYV